MHKSIAHLLIIIAFCVAVPLESEASVYLPDSLMTDTIRLTESNLRLQNNRPVSPYALPYSVTGNSYDRHRLWINTATLGGAFVGTLLVLECLPEDATAWNRAELQDVPLHKRWHKHVIKKGPEWDHDKFYFNYILHPYAGAVYYMSARSCGFNAWRSLLYCTCVSTIGWEFGIEAFMERPSIQDIFITPLVGSAIGECFYKLKRRIVSNGYKLGGSSFLGNTVAFLVDPVNEVIDIFRGRPSYDINRPGRPSARMHVETAFLPYATTHRGSCVSLRLIF